MSRYSAPLVVLLAAPLALAGDVDLHTIRHGAHYLRLDSGEINVGTPNFQVGEVNVQTVGTQIIHNFAAFDLTALEPGSIAAATFVVINAPRAYFSEDASETYTMFRFAGDAAQLVDLASSPEIHADLGDGEIIGQAVIDESMDEQAVAIPLTAAGVADLNARAGGVWAFGGKLTSVDGDPASSEMLFTFNLDRPPIAYRLVLTLSDPCVGDVDGDGAAGSGDLARLLAGWGGGGVADFDGDGVIGSSDLAVLLAAWGPCSG